MRTCQTLVAKTRNIRQLLGALILSSGGLLLLNQAIHTLNTTWPGPESRYEQDSPQEPTRGEPEDTELA